MNEQKHGVRGTKWSMPCSHCVPDLLQGRLEVSVEVYALYGDHYLLQCTHTTTLLKKAHPSNASHSSSS